MAYFQMVGRKGTQSPGLQRTRTRKRIRKFNHHRVASGRPTAPPIARAGMRPSARARRQAMPNFERVDRSKFWQQAIEGEKKGSPLLIPFFSTVNKFPFSNMAAVDVDFGGRKFHSSEQAYLFYQAMAYQLPEVAVEILCIACPKQAARFFRSHPQVAPIRHNPQNPLYQKWVRSQRGIMERILSAKFKTSGPARDALLASHPSYLVEASPSDRFWGAGLQANDPRLQQGPAHPSWGENYLGRLLMRVRERELKNDQEASSSDAPDDHHHASEPQLRRPGP